MNYLNTRPLLYGIERSQVLEEMELIGDYPANVAKALVNGSIDIGLVPVAIIPHLKEFHIYTDFGIGCNGKVATVCIFSEVPLEKITHLQLDYQSRTSVMLAKVLLKEYFGVQPEFIAASHDFRAKIKGTVAAVVIGDRCFEQAKLSKYQYDLGEAWKAYTGLPFLFAAWISNKPLNKGFVQRFNEANAIGINHIEEIVEALNFTDYDLVKYYRENIEYNIDADKIRAMKLFLEKIKVIEEVKQE